MACLFCDCVKPGFSTKMTNDWTSPLHVFPFSSSSSPLRSLVILLYCSRYIFVSPSTVKFSCCRAKTSRLFMKDLPNRQDSADLIPEPVTRLVLLLRMKLDDRSSLFLWLQTLPFSTPNQHYLLLRPALRLPWVIIPSTNRCKLDWTLASHLHIMDILLLHRRCLLNFRPQQSFPSLLEMSDCPGNQPFQRSWMSR